MDCAVARALYEQGFTTPVSVAGAPRAELLRTLRKTLPHDETCIKFGGLFEDIWLPNATYPFIYC